MIALEQARGYLEQLGLTEAALVLQSRLEAAAHKELADAEFLADLLSIERAAAVPQDNHASGAPALQPHPRAVPVLLPALHR